MPDWKLEVERFLKNPAIEPGLEASIVEELAQHLEDTYRGLLSGGVDEKTAYEATLRELDNAGLISAALRSAELAPKHDAVQRGDTPSGSFAGDLTRDLRYGLRGMRKNAAFTFFAVLTLALGIGTNTTVFTIVNTLLLHPFPAHDPSRLVAVAGTETKTAKQSGSLLPISYPNLADYAQQNQVFSGTAGYLGPLAMTLGDRGGTQRIFSQLVTKDYFETLGLTPALGRFFRPAEDRSPGSAAVAVLSHSAWQGRFGGMPDVIGRKLQINDAVFTVIGVAPPGFIGISAVFGPDVWLPATMADQVLPDEMRGALEDRTKPLFYGVGRLKPGVTRGQAEANLRAVAVALEREYPDANEGHTASLLPISDELFSNLGGARSMVFVSAVLLIVVGLVLLIACSNVANLLLARSTARRQEIAVRLALGANRSRLVRQLLTESVLLGLLGGAVGLAVGYGGTRFLWSFRPAEVANNLIDLKLDGNVLLFAIAISILTGLIFGIVPALRESKADVVETLKDNAATAGRSRRSVTVGNFLLAGQVALSLISLITAALFLHSIQRAYQLDPGFQTKHLAIFLMNKGRARYDRARTKALYRDLGERIAGMPNVASVSWASNLPFWARATSGITIEGRAPRKKADTITSVVNTVDTNYFETMAIPLLEGRTFTDGDRDGTLPVAIINETLAEKYWPGGRALGQRFQLAGDKVARQVIGIAKTANYTTLGEAPQPCVYLPLKQNFSDSMNLYVKSKGDPAGVLTAVQQEIRNLDPKIEVSDARTGAKLIGQVLFSAQFVVVLLTAFGLIALALASVGLYGVMAYSVNRRQRELGLRMALGAKQSEVLTLVLRQGMTVVGIGIAAGMVISLLVGRALSASLFGVSPADPLSLGGASAVLITVAVLACYFPARSASRVDPMVALREA
jgi:predicted permease